MSLRLYLDMDSLDSRLVQALRRSGMDVLLSPEAGNERTPDEEQLAYATSQGRVLYTGNRGDFARLHKRWMESGRSHAGIIVRGRHRTSVGDQLRGLTRIAGAFEQQPTTDRFEYLENWL